MITRTTRSGVRRTLDMHGTDMVRCLNCHGEHPACEMEFASLEEWDGEIFWEGVASRHYEEERTRPRTEPSVVPCGAGCRRMADVNTGCCHLHA